MNNFNMKILKTQTEFVIKQAEALPPAEVLMVLCSGKFSSFSAT